MSETTIFLSYAWTDGTKFAEQLRDTLEKDYAIWRDRDQNMAGEDFIEKICLGIRNSTLMIAVMTPNSVRLASDPANQTKTDSVCLNEIQEARFRAKIPIIPVMAIQCEEPFAINRLDYVDLTSFPEDQAVRNGIDRIVKRIQAVLAGEPVPIRCRSTALDSLDETFERFLGELRGGFRGRQWIFDDINSWLKNESQKLLAIAGAPGCGKSTVAAELVYRNSDSQVLAYHVCKADRTATINPATFVRSISDMIATRIEEYRTKLNDPAMQDWLDKAVDDPHAAFEFAVLNPLAKISREAEGYILIDGLDEALASEDRTNILEILASSLSCLPNWLRVVVTCQGEAERRMDQLCPKKIEIKGERNREDVQEYLAFRLRDPKLKAALSKAGKEPEKITSWVRNLDEGNYDSNMLFVKVLLNEIEARPADELKEDELPRELDGLYESWLKRFYQGLGGEQRQEGRRLLGIISAAAESLTRPQIARASGTASYQLLPDLLRNLSAYLPETEGGIRAFNKSFSEWLAKEQNPYGADMECGRQSLAELCRQEYQKLKDVPPGAPIPSGDSSGVRNYALRHGVRHLLEVGDCANAVDLLAFLFDHEAYLDETVALSLGRYAKEVSRRVGSCDPGIARSVDPLKLASILRRFYEIEPQYGGIRMLVNYHSDRWEEILDQLLSDDDFVIRFTVARALADPVRDKTSPKLPYILQLAKHADVDRKELGAYALKLVYAKLPGMIEAAALNTLAGSDIYSSRSVLGDLLLHLAFTGKDRSRLVTEQRFWNAIWDFNKLDIWDLRAISGFCCDPPTPPGGADEERDSYQVLQNADALRRGLLGNDAGVTPGISSLLQQQQYRSLGIRTEAIRGVQEELEKSAALPAVMRVLFSHPLWDVVEEAASVLSDMRPTIAGPIIQEFLADNSWRLRYGAIEAAFGLRYVDNYALFTKAVQVCYNDSNCRVRALCVENLTAQILACEAEQRQRWCSNFAVEIRSWLKDEDCWVLEHVYRLFRQLDRLGDDYGILLGGGVSRLFESTPNWYQMERGDFLKLIETSKIQMVQPSNIH